MCPINVRRGILPFHRKQLGNQILEGQRIKPDLSTQLTHSVERFFFSKKEKKIC